MVMRPGSPARGPKWRAKRGLKAAIPNFSRLCFHCFSITLRHGHDVKHRPCFKPGCHCWCSFVTGYTP